MHNRTVTTPADWTSLPGWPRSNGADDWNAKQYVFYRFAGASEPSSYDFDKVEYVGSCGLLVAVAGIDSADPVHATSWAGNPGDTSVTAPELTTTIDGAFVLGIVGLAGTVAGPITLATPAALVEDVEAALDWHSAEIASMTLEESGSTGPQSWTLSEAGHAVAALVGLRPR